MEYTDIDVDWARGLKTEEDIDRLNRIDAEWTDKHYDHYYYPTEQEIADGKIKLDVYKVSKVWKIGSKDDSGALWHTFKIFPRFGEKNSIEREIIAMHNQIKALANVHGVKLDK
jgi:hypothetical protein